MAYGILYITSNEEMVTIQFGYRTKGKLVYRDIPKNNHTKPKTKRLRKKKLWLKCGDCTQWFKRYEKPHATRKDGKHVCNACLQKCLNRR